MSFKNCVLLRELRKHLKPILLRLWLDTEYIISLRSRHSSQRILSRDPQINPLRPKDPYSGRTAPLTSKRCILYIYSTNTGTEYFKHGI